MTHSHDRTLLTALGFADPDKREPLHDLACEYLADPAQSHRLVSWVTGVENPSTSSSLEVAISKGEGQYRTTIGFLDLRIKWETETSKGNVLVEVKINPTSVGDILRQINLYREYTNQMIRDPDEMFRRKLANMNGRTIPESGEHWVLAVAFPMDDGQQAILRSADIHPVRLENNFTKWFHERQQKPPAKMDDF